MNALKTSVCVTALGAAAAVAGVSPETFASNLRGVIESQAIGVEIAQGRISSVASDKLSFVIKGDGDRLTTIRITEKTTFTLDGQASDREKALSAGRSAKVTHEGGIANRVEVMTEK